MIEDGVVKTTFSLNKVPTLLRLGHQFLVVVLDLVMGASFGFLLGGEVGYRLACTAVGAMLGLALGIAAARKMGGASTPLSMIIDATHLRLLSRQKSKNVVLLPLEEVRSIEERGKARSRMLIISTQRRAFLLPWMAYTAGFPQRLRDAVRASLALRPRGDELVAAMVRREELGRELMRRRPRVVWTLVLFVCVAFGVEVARRALYSPGAPLSLGANSSVLTAAAQRALDSPAALLSLGGNAPVLVAEGQWWRLLTANFLHVSWLHFYLNCFALALLGSIIERLVGALRMLAISLVAGITGNVASALTSAHVFSVGISSMVFGMIGALLVVNLRSRNALPAGFHLSWPRWALLLGLNGLISALPAVDGFAHLGGFAGGVAAALILVPKSLESRQTHVAAGLVGASLALAYFSALGAAVLNATKGDARADFLHAALDNPRLPPASLNNLAWQFAINPATRPDELATIARATTRLVDENPREITYRDTHAYVLYREGHFDQALEQERIALMGAETRASRASLYTMFLRFLAERRSWYPDGTTVRRDGDVVIVECPVPGAVIFAGNPEQGLVRIILPEGVREAHMAAPPGLGGSGLPVWLVDGAGPEPRAATVQISFAPRDAATAALP